ncbi:MAG: hypothetical protein OXF06_02955, partial [Bacteroidetes bacterium]|nr:hypothetical protein [Bacteroidota bacterium]
IHYANCGDWIESCTALVEHSDGRIELLNWVTMDHQPLLTRWENSISDPNQNSRSISVNENEDV